MKKLMPVFSIIICTYNGSKKITRCLKSIFAQNYNQKKFEVIVVDDGSTDNTHNIISNFSITILTHKENMGIASSRKTGLAKAKGIFTVCIDDDCEVNKDYLLSIETKYKDKNVMGVAANLIIPKKSSIINRYFAATWYGVAIPKQKEKKTIADRIIWYYKNCPWKKDRNGYSDGAVIEDMPAACSSYQTKMIKKIGGWDDKLKNASEDNDLTNRMRDSYKNKMIVLSKNALVTHHQNLSLYKTLVREFNRSRDRRNYYEKYKLFPSIFPNPIFFFSFYINFLPTSFLYFINTFCNLSLVDL